MWYLACGMLICHGIPEDRVQKSTGSITLSRRTLKMYLLKLCFNKYIFTWVSRGSQELFLIKVLLGNSESLVYYYQVAPFFPPNSCHPVVSLQKRQTMGTADFSRLYNRLDHI
jgi:hypothetical protein